MTGTRVSAPSVPFIDLRAQHETIAAEIDAAIHRVIGSGNFVLGPAVAAFEEAFARYIGVKECVCVNSGTAALQLALMGIGLERGDEVIIPSNTFIATAEAVIWAGGRPVLVDVREDDFNMDPEAMRAAITPRTRAIVPVDLYGQPARLDEIQEIADRHGLPVVEDACQAHGASLGTRKAGSFGRSAAFSFYPGKNLGAYGEGGAVLTNDPATAQRARMLRDHGQSRKYDHALLGHNYRLEALQGAVLGAKLGHLDRWNESRRRIAAAYRSGLDALPVGLPQERGGARHVYHLFVVRSRRRDELREFLAGRGIETLVHYPIPLHRQRAMNDLGFAGGEFPVSDKLASEIVSLPIYPEMPDASLERVCEAIAAFCARKPVGG